MTDADPQQTAGNPAERKPSGLRRIAQATGLMRILRSKRHPGLSKEKRRVLASGQFDPAWYMDEYPDVRASGADPLDHYILHGRSEGRLSGPPQNLAQARELRAYADQMLAQASEPLGANPEYRPLSQSSLSSSELAIRAIAFYLPQYHPIPENDTWWGRGFTEWTNVSKAVPQFVGHYQPHLPGELGFYDLRVPQVQERQAELARQYGLAGFCFHTYWFAGKRLLERPLDQFLQHTEWDLGFCLSWANENWTRRWDGLESDILMAQAHSAQDDLAFIAEMERYLLDPRYIRIGGKPLLVLYRPALLPDPDATAARFREYWRSHGHGDLYLAYTQAFAAEGTAPKGFDASIEFPPHGFGIEVDYQKLSFVNPDYAGHVYEYSDLAAFYRRRTYTGQTVFRTVTPGWDNTARKLARGRVFNNSTPDAYAEWLDSICRATLSHTPAERLVFINAWNEWAEGAHLEPDRRFGYAYLKATADVLKCYPAGDVAD